MASQQKSAPRLTHGVPEFLGDWADKLADFADGQRPLEGAGTSITDAPGGGKIIEVASANILNGGAISQVCWTPKVSGGANPTMTLSPGTINELLPVNMFSVLYLIPGSLNYIVANVKTNGQWPTTITLATQIAPPTASGIPATGSAPINFQVVLALWQGAIGGAPGGIFQIQTQPLNYIPEVVAISPIEDPEPGQDPFDRLWAWVNQNGDNS